MYRPLYSEDHPITAGNFFHEFAEYLKSLVIPSNKLLITVDFNFHIDVPTDPNDIHFKDPLDTMGLVQHVKLPTHIHGHTLDLIIYHIGYTIESQQTLGKKFIQHFHEGQTLSLGTNTITRHKHYLQGQTISLI